MTVQWIVGIASGLLVLVTFGAIMAWLAARSRADRAAGAQGQAGEERAWQSQIANSLRTSEKVVHTEASDAVAKLDAEHAARQAAIRDRLRAVKEHPSPDLEAQVKAALDRAQALQDDLIGGKK